MRVCLSTLVSPFLYIITDVIAAGHVRAVGPGITAVQVGDPVLLSFDSCQSCSHCSAGHPAYCDSFPVKNYVGRPGPTKGDEKVWGSFFGQSSFAQFSIVSEGSIVNAKGLVENDDELKLFSPLGCGFQTGVGAVLNVTAATEQDAVMVLGVGGVGFAAIMAAKVKGCRAIIAVDRVAERLQLAKELGATHIINTAEISISETLDKDPSIRPSIAIDTTGVPALLEEALEALGKRGKLVIVGIPPFGYNLPFAGGKHLTTGKSVMGCMEGDSVPEKALKDMIQWYRDGKFPIEKLVSYFPAAEYKEAVDKLKDGSVIKPVLVWK
ncbi:hypothetical protein ASPWEDRAFT_45306 [Aspergillus wentii DTO 134E9]|uniref:Enoyl reductase (ER) domain-containing protein n=1 Tax=Aspergillus wentii DTO 134E9 TaxID=1073089 RepID=A0A1L9R8W1_ASPWE|nr:uncharacterized protein ASPWEDRAFT_45306 [Aspergillus wentii DTO 134E9]OJJ31360.1 hypothetical protein ASPWEDRAFT_45306 [Aspergillus wentii DTO 134E9]